MVKLLPGIVIFLHFKLVLMLQRFILVFYSKPVCIIHFVFFCRKMCGFKSSTFDRIRVVIVLSTVIIATNLHSHALLYHFRFLN